MDLCERREAHWHCQLPGEQQPLRRPVCKPRHRGCGARSPLGSVGNTPGELECPQTTGGLRAFVPTPPPPPPVAAHLTHSAHDGQWLRLLPLELSTTATVGESTPNKPPFPQKCQMHVTSVGPNGGGVGGAWGMHSSHAPHTVAVPELVRLRLYPRRCCMQPTKKVVFDMPRVHPLLRAQEILEKGVHARQFRACVRVRICV